jgi:glucose 1-dehydrogenase
VAANIMRLTGKTAVVTGAARGIGAAIARAFVSEGAKVTAFDLRPAEAPDARVLHITGDVADRDAVQGMLDRTAAEFGSVDILVNNAAYSSRAPFLEMPIEEVRKTWDVGLWGVFHASQIAARRMVQQGGGGSIIQISSVHASRPYVNATAYNAAKAAVNHISATWALELACHRIRVNVIEPGWIDTPGERAFLNDQQIAEAAAKLPFGRLGTPEEIARGAVYLASDDASYVTGTVLRIDGAFALAR